MTGPKSLIQGFLVNPEFDFIWTEEMYKMK
jgi:hypothetical protein